MRGGKTLKENTFVEWPFLLQNSFNNPKSVFLTLVENAARMLARTKSVNANSRFGNS